MKNERFYERQRFSKKQIKDKLKRKTSYISYKRDYSFGDFLSDVGNLEITNFFESGIIQAKLNTNQSNDYCEQEADRIANNIINSDTFKVTNVNRVQGKSNVNIRPVNSNTESKIKILKGKGNPLNKSVREYFEPRFGVDLGNVRVHTDKNANQLANSINARAFTFGNNIVFGKNQYQPDTTEGKKLIAHELTHTQQQRKEVQGNIVQKKTENSGNQAIIELAMKHGDDILKENIADYLINEVTGNSNILKDQIKSIFLLNHKIHMEKSDKMSTLISDIELGNEIAVTYGYDYILDYPELRILMYLYEEFGRNKLYWNTSKWGDSNPFDNNDEYAHLLADFFESYISDTERNPVKKKKLLRKGFRIRKKNHRYNNPTEFTDKVRENKKIRQDKRYKNKIERGKERDKGVIYKYDDDPAVTILTNGTNDITKQKGETELMKLADIYFVTRSGEMNSYEAADEINERFGGKQGIFIPWNGANNDGARQDAANIIIEEIKNLKEQNNGKILKLNLVGHSHGGNVMIIVANMIYKDPELKDKVEVINLLSLEAPVREYHLEQNKDNDEKNDINFIHTYSPLDFVQKIGYIDVGGGEYAGYIMMLLIGLPLSIFGILRLVPEASHQFDEATMNVNTRRYNSPEIRRRYKELLTLLPGANVLHHQSSRYVDFIDQVIEVIKK